MRRNPVNGEAVPKGLKGYFHLDRCQRDRRPTRRIAQQQLRLLALVDAQLLLRGPTPAIPAEAKRRAGTPKDFAARGPGSAIAVRDCLFVMCKYGWAG
ncbi:hypothetical protein AEM38_02650 [Hyphomonadaceae bacterium UKL13-1]|nr:hypothetical protein AEM38_02650 [Hyphomonadaceae bacterium UKL13-1]